MPAPFPDLPIITPPTGDRMSTPEKYGGLFYLGVGGLIALIGVIGWFVWGVAANWSMWMNIYTLHDVKRPEAERLAAASALAKDSRMNQRQVWDIVMRRELPAAARYTMAEALNSEATIADPVEYARTVAFSEPCPDWLRVLLARPMGYAANRGISFPGEPIAKLRLTGEPFVRTWALYVQAIQRGGDPIAQKELEESAASGGLHSAMARLLVESLREPGSGRREKLDEATRRIRLDMPDAAALFK